MREDRKQWEGQTVNGKFPLLRYLGGTEHSHLFLTERRLGNLAIKSAIKLRPAVGQGDDILLSRWRQTATLSHPHLVRLFESGVCEISNIPMLFVVMDYAEENLAEVLSDRALTPAEAGAMLESVLEVLALLHSKGFAHGHLKPSNIMAVDEQLKVSCDDLRRTGESGDGPGRPDAYDPPEYALGLTPATQAISPAADVWALGVTLVEALTQKLPDVSSPENCLEAPRGLPNPFADIVSRCLVWDPNARWTVAEIAAWLRNPVPAPVPFRTPAATQASASEPASSASPPQLVGQSQRPRAKMLVFAVLLAVGLALVAIPVGIRLLNLTSEAVRAPSAAAVEQPANPAPEKLKLDEPQTKTAASSPVLEKEDSKRRAAAPAVARAENPSTGGPAGKVELSSASTARGEVVQKVLPDVSQSASDTIHGTVRVSVRVDVDPSGAVQNADLVSPGASKYFAVQALQAALRWKFLAPKAAEGSVPSTWTLRFEFTREGTTVLPTQESP